MTKPLVTKYNLGDSVAVTMVADSPDDPLVGEVGVIRRIVIADPDDGDVTFLMFVVRFRERCVRLAECEIASGQAVEAALWLQKQLATLDPKGGK